MEFRGLTPEDFKRLPKDGARFESLVCHLLEAMGFRILEKPSIGTEGGRDVLVERTLKDVIGERREKVIVQCKHYAHSGRAVGDKDVGVWENAMRRYRARGYLLVTDTRTTENLSRSFREFTDDESNYPNWAYSWDVDQLISHLNSYPIVRDSFLPKETVSTPLQELAAEVRTWLLAIRYEVSAPQASSEHTIDMIATLNQGTINQQVFVRCIGGEIKSADVDKLSKNLDIQTPQGWLISDRRVSGRARGRASKIGTIGVYNLSNLLQEKIWGPYFEALDTLVRMDQLQSRYVDIACYKLETDAQGNEIERETYNSLDSYIDDWLNERGKMHISLLGDFGSGKTWFCRHYAKRQLERFLNNPAKERMPLLITLRMFAKAMTAQQLINHAMVEQYKLPFIGSAFNVFQEMNRRGKLLLILDGFDEMARKVDYQTVVDNFWELAKLVEEGSKVILTSRTEYFRWAKESEKVLGGEEHSRRTLILESPRFEVLYLDPLGPDKIREIIIRRVGKEQGVDIATKILNARNLAEIARKPLLIELLLAALNEASVDILQNQSQVFLYATHSLLLRNITAEKTFTSTSDKLYFLCELAWEMIKSGELRTHFTSFPERIKAYFGSRIQDQHELDTWDYDLRSQTLLHRDAAGYYEFAHKSLAEYFVALKFAAELDCLNESFSQTYCDVDGRPCQVFIAPKTMGELSGTFGFVAFNQGSEEILNFLVPMLSTEATGKLWSLLEETKGKPPKQVNYTGGNAASILNQLKFDFRDADLTQMVLHGAILDRADLSNANLTETLFDNSRFRYSDLSAALCTRTSFRNAIILNVRLKETIFDEADFTGVNLKVSKTILTISFNHEGKLIASGSGRSVEVWEIESRERINLIKDHVASLQSVRFSPNDDLVASADTAGNIRVSKLDSGDTLWIERPYADYVRWIDYDPSGQLLASVGESTVLIIWAATTGERVRELTAPDNMLSVAFSTDENLIAAGTKEGTMIVWEVPSARIVWQSKVYDGEVHFVGFNADSTRLISGGIEVRQPTSTESAITAESPSIDELSLDRNFVIKTWDTSQWKCTQQISSPYLGGWNRGSVSLKSRYVAARLGRNECAIWDYETGEQIHLLQGHYDVIFCTSFSPDGRHLATCSRDGSIRMWDTNSGKLENVIMTIQLCAGSKFNKSIGLNSDHHQLLKNQGAEISA